MTSLLECKVGFDAVVLKLNGQLGITKDSVLVIRTQVIAAI